MQKVLFIPKVLVLGLDLTRKKLLNTYGEVTSHICGPNAIAIL